MKRYLLVVITLFLLSGCSIYKNESFVNTNHIKKNEVEILPNEPKYIDDNPIVVGLYRDGRLVNELTTPFKTMTDIAIFDVYFTNDEYTGSTNTKRNFNKYATNYSEVDKYKIGFFISFLVGDEIIKGVITGPEDIFLFAPYIYNYLYDDVHQPDGAWYSHVEEKDVNENTIYSSIKLFAAQDINKVTSPITLMVFTYDTQDDFDENGMYRGNSKYSITIKR